MNTENKYSIIVDTMKRMYEKKEITISQVKTSFNKNIISLEEYNYILGKK